MLTGEVDIMSMTSLNNGATIRYKSVQETYHFIFRFSDEYIFFKSAEITHFIGFLQFHFPDSKFIELEEIFYQYAYDQRYDNTTLAKIADILKAVDKVASRENTGIALLDEVAAFEFEMKLKNLIEDHNLPIQYHNIEETKKIMGFVT